MLELRYQSNKFKLLLVTLISLEITFKVSDLEQNATAESMPQDSCLVIKERQSFCLELLQLLSCHLWIVCEA